MTLTWEAILVWILVGLIAGWLASLVVGGGKGLVRYIIAGLLGSVVGGLIFSFFGISLPIESVWIRELIIATVGAIIIIVLARVIA